LTLSWVQQVELVAQNIGEEPELPAPVVVPVRTKLKNPREQLKAEFVRS
jgi:hypothetical protein